MANDESTDKGYLSAITRRDEDGMLFVDYLKGLRGESDDPAVYAEFLQRHRDFIDRRLNTLAGCPRIRQKYTWLIATTRRL